MIGAAEARALAARARPGEQVEVVGVRSRTVDVEVRDGEVEAFSAAIDGGISVRVIFDHREGLAWSAGRVDPAEVLEAARSCALVGERDEALGLPDQAETAGEPVVADLWSEDVPATAVGAKVALARELERATRAADPRVCGTEKTAYRDAAAETLLVTSTGVERHDRRTSCSCVAVAMADDGRGVQTGWGIDAARAFGRLDPASAAAEAAGRAVRVLGARPVRSRRATVVLDPLVTRSLLAFVGGTLNGEAVQRRRSVFSDRLGEQVGAEAVTLVEDPTRPDAWGAAGHDGEGVPTRRLPLIAEGRLEAFLHNVVSARRCGARTTGSATRGLRSAPGVGARALHLAGGRRGLGEILADVDAGLYVQEVTGWHSGANPVSGDVSLGALGCLVSGGALGTPVREVTISETLPRLLRSVREVGGDERWLPGGAAGVTLVIDDVMVSGR